MTYIRIGFLGAFLLLLLGGYTVRKAVAPYFSSASAPPAPAPTKTPTARAVAHRVALPTNTAVVVTATPTATATLIPTPSPTPRVIVVTARPAPSRTHQARRRAAPVRRVTRRIHRAARHRAAPHPTATASPTPVPTTGVVALSNYWVDSQRAREGQTIAIGYVIRNDTGRTERVMLGASLKARSVPSWTEAINDPNHDVVAIVPPGATVHVRYFSLPPGLRPGVYDVAWGLRDAETGQRLGLAFAPSVVRVTR